MTVYCLIFREIIDEVDSICYHYSKNIVGVFRSAEDAHKEKDLRNSKISKYSSERYEVEEHEVK